MARGKHAAHSARQRHEAAMEHLDRLTEQLADAKLRARQYEDAARRLPGLVAEIERLRSDRDAAVSPEVLELRSLLDRANHELGIAGERYFKLQDAHERLCRHFLCGSADLRAVSDRSDIANRQEELVRITGPEPLEITTTVGMHPKEGLDAEAVRRIQAARRIRRRVKNFDRLAATRSTGHGDIVKVVDEPEAGPP